MTPLEGIRVIDFSRVLAGPYATQIMAELGAEVVKVERPGTGDESRAFEPRWPDGSSAYFTAHNRGKRSVTLDLSSDEGAAAARRLALSADVVVENFLPGRMARFGLDAATLRAEKPALVYVSCTGFGQDGPAAQRPGYDTVFQALSGVTALTGHPDGPPSKAGVPVADLTSALWIVLGALAALQGRAATGQGTYVDLAMMDAQHALLTIPTARLFALGEDPTRMGNAHAGRVPSSAWETADGDWVQISGSDQHWAGLCDALGLDALAAEPAFTRNAARVARRCEIEPAIAAAVAARSTVDVITALEAAHVPIAPVLSVRDALATEQARHRGTVAETCSPGGATVPALRLPLREAGRPAPRPCPAPALGADTDAVLAGLGYDEAERARMRKEGIT